MSTPNRSIAPLLMWLGYVVFVVYGSLVPLNYQPHTFEEAWNAFQRIPYLNLGVGSRADWISNGVLYVPLGFLTAYLFIQTFRNVPRSLVWVIAATFSVALAVGVEFVQFYFPPRTVSQNDILAECIGSGIGILLATTFSHWFSALFETYTSDSHRFKKLVLNAYVVIYIAIALFPYDFLVSGQEIADKLNSDNWGWLIAGSSRRPVLLGIQSFAEIILTLPIGLLLANLVSRHIFTAKSALIFGLLLGITLEMLQLLMVTGVAQGLSILTRFIGVYLGLMLSQYAVNRSSKQITDLLRRFSIPIAIVYVLALLEINEFFSMDWRGLEEAIDQIDQVNFTPFYYHYFVSEAKALFSLSIVFLSYVPAAFLVWLHGRSPRVAFFVTFTACAGIEVGKLFLPTTHSDPINLLIAGVAGWMTVRFLQQITTSPPVSRSMATTYQKPVEKTIKPNKVVPIWLMFVFLATGIWVLNFPVLVWAVAATLMIASMMIWRRPALVFAVIPAALPVFDLAPLSGRFFLDEYDALLFVSIAIAYVRAPAKNKSRVGGDPLLFTLVTLVVLSFAVAAVRGLLPFQWPDINSFNTYYSPYNSLRILKGVVWGFLFYALYRRFAFAGMDTRRIFAWGITIGLILTVIFILWERVAFSGLWNFASSYRVTGPFSAIHIGGAYIECFLAVAAPFLIGLLIEDRRVTIRLAAISLLLATTYTLMVTFSRNGFVSFAVGVFVVMIFAVINSRRIFRNSVLYLGTAGAMLLVAAPIYKGEFAQARMATLRADLDVRWAQWQGALDIRDTNLATSAFGMGLGRFPETSYWRSTDKGRSGTYRFEQEGENRYLRLGSGDSLYFEQLVDVKAKENYTLKLDVRSSEPNKGITVPICEKLMLTSYNCIWTSFKVGQQVGTWHSVEKKFTAKELPISPWYSQRPIKLALYYSSAKSTIDVDNVRLETDQGVNIVRNGDFSSTLDGWFFSTDGHLQWHIKSLFYGVLFDQGWFGLAALGAFFMLAIGRAVRHALQGDGMASASLAALLSFLTVGLFDTLIDSPRFLMLFLILGCICASKAGLKTRQR